MSALTTKRTARVVLKIATNIQGKNPVGTTAANTNPVTIGGVDGDNDIVGLVLNSDGSITAKLGAGTSIVGKFIPVDADGDEKFTATNPAIVDSNFDGGIATGGSKTTIIDTSKNFETNMFAGHTAKVTISGVDYYRTVASNTATTLTITALPGAAASAIVGTPGTAEVTVVYVNEGVAGNSITAEVVAAPGDNDNLSASFTDNVLTVYLGKTGGVLDDAKNTATLVASKIDELAEFTATMTGSGGVVPVASAVTFTGGIAVVSVAAGSDYQIMRKNVVADGGGSITVDQSTHDNFNANVNLQVGNTDVATGNPVPTVLAGSIITNGLQTRESWIPVAIIDESVGISKIFTVPTNTEYEILSITVLFVASAVAGNRGIRILMSTGTTGQNYARHTTGVNITAGQTRQITFAPNLLKETTTDLTGTQLSAPIARCIIPAGHKISISDLASIDAVGDSMKIYMLIRQRTV